MKHNISEIELWNNREHRINFIKNNIDTIFLDVKLKDGCIEVLKKLEKDNKKLKTDVLEWCDIISMESKKMSRDTKINI